MAEELEYLGCSHEAARLLPWFVAGALADDEVAQVQAHLRECANCAADEKRERGIYALLSDESRADGEEAAREGLDRLMARVDEYERVHDDSTEGHGAAVAAGAAQPRYTRWLVAAVVVQAVGLGVLGALHWDRARMHDPRFTTLSTPAPDVSGQPRLRVVFAPTLTIGEVQAVLSAVHAAIVAGPTEAGVYTLAVTGREPSLDAAIRALRATPGVLFAEPQ